MTMMNERADELQNGLLDFTPDRKTVTKSAINSILIQILFKLKGIITMLVITYYLTPAEYGVFNIILVTSSMLVPLFSMNLTDGPMRYFVQEKSKCRIINMYNTVTNGVILFSFILLPVFWAIMYRVGGDYYRYLPLIVLLLFSNLLYKLVTYVLAVFQKTTMLVKNTMIRDVSATILSIAAVIAGYSFSGMITALVVTNISAALLVYRFTRKELRYSLTLDWEILCRFLKISLPLLPVFFFSWVIQSSDSYFLAYFKGEETVGKYSVVYGLTNVILSLTDALNFFWFPVSARFWVENRAKYLKIFMTLFTGFAAALFVIVGLFELNARFIMGLIVRRPEYHDAYVIMGIIAFAFAMQVLINLLTAPLYANGNTRAIFTAYLSGGLVNTLLNIFLIPAMGIFGAAVSTALSYLVIVLLMSWMSYRLADFAFFDRRLIRVTLVFFLTWGVFAWIRGFVPTYQVLLLNVVALPAAAALLYRVVLRSDEKEYLHGIYAILKLKLRGEY